MDNAWLANGTLITPSGVIRGAVHVVGGRIRAVRPRPPRSARIINVRGAYLAPGFIDLHVWGEPDTVSREFARSGTTAFLRTIGPEPWARMLAHLTGLRRQLQGPGAACAGAHLEGPFLSPVRGGALPTQWMRRPTRARLGELSSTGPVRLITLAPELPGALEAIRWCRRSGIPVSLGHSDANAAVAARAVDAGAVAVTHVFNGMPPFHHRAPGLLDVALDEPRLTTMAIVDGVHMSPQAFRLLLRTKGAGRIALVTDSIQHQGWNVVERRNAYYLKNGTLAGSRLTMVRAVRNAVRFGATLTEAVRMATEVPARVLGDRSRGVLAVGRRADLVAFDTRFRVRLTMVGGRIVYQRGT